MLGRTAQRTVAAMATNTLSALDATFLELEQQNDGALMSIGGVMVFEELPGGGIPSLQDVCSGLAGRLRLLPRYAQRLSSTHVGGLAWPHWVDHDRFELRHHVRRVALPGPGHQTELSEWAADFYSHPLDRTRPLWEMVLIEGLEDGRWALAHKTHHCLVDGVGSVDVAYLLLDAEPDPPQRALPQTVIQDDFEFPGALLKAVPDPIAQAAQVGLQAAHAGARAALHPSDAFRRSRALAELLLRDELIAAPHTSINRPIGQGRCFAVRTVALDEVKEIGSALGGSVNDVVLAACTTGLRLLFEGRGEEPPPRGLRAMVPMNVRDSSARLALGNRVSSLFVELPVAEPLAERRLCQIVEATQRLKSSGAASGATAMLDLAALAPPVLHASLARSLYADRLFNITITNVPGPQQPLYALGAELIEVHPVVPLAADHAIGIAIFSYNGRLTFGVIADAGTTPDIDVLADGIDHGMGELAALARATG
jgi:WS/DGAT/MGAT family acyltransferase